MQPSCYFGLKNSHKTLPTWLRQKHSKPGRIILGWNKFNHCLRTLFELNTKFSSPAMVECSLPAAQPLFVARTAAMAVPPATRLPSTCFSNSGRPFAFLSFLLFLSSSLSFLSHCSTVLYKPKPQKTQRYQHPQKYKNNFNKRTICPQHTLKTELWCKRGRGFVFETIEHRGFVAQNPDHVWLLFLEVLQNITVVARNNLARPAWFAASISLTCTQPPGYMRHRDVGQGSYGMWRTLPLRPTQTMCTITALSGASYVTLPEAVTECAMYALTSPASQVSSI